MKNVKMVAVDQLHLSSIGPESLHAGAEFFAAAEVADDLEERGLAKRLAKPKPATSETRTTD